MGQKVNPHGARVGINKGWDAQWYADKNNFSKYILEDNTIRTFLKKKYYGCQISKIAIIRAGKKLTVDIFTGAPGKMIGQKGANIEVLKAEVKKLSKADDVNINIKEIKNVSLDAQLVAEAVAVQLERRVQFRRAMKKPIQIAMEKGAKGIKIMVSGRLDGAEIARSENYHEGSIPLQTLRADIDYGFAEAHTTFGVIGVKVWVYKGEILGKFNAQGGKA